MKFILKINIILAICTIMMSFSSAKPERIKNDPRRPVGKISKDLGITTKQFIECL